MKLFYVLLIGVLLDACAGNQSAASVAEASAEAPASGNPAAQGFNEAASDARAIAIADSVMLAMGGRQAWDATRFITWNFFGRRTLVWDKNGQRVRIEIPDQQTIYLLNLADNKGRVMLQGQEMIQPDTVSKYLAQARSIWINDSYWLMQPFKYKDSGVTLKYLGEENTPEGRPAYKMQLTFENVGDTPQNKYHVYVDQERYLQIWWQYFQNAADAEPRVNGPWANYQRHGRILLSGGRGERQLSDIEVLDTVPDAAFEEFGAWR